ncbi:hypothetical protein BJF89_13940 [Corynebacterium sp. CNJ-954]|nr:hypothetical protein BJF89_13940 [Corynebacterium sp. CNJ-954]
MFTIGDFAEFAGIPVEDVDERWFYWRLVEVEDLIRSYNESLPGDVNVWPRPAVTVAMRVLKRSFKADISDHPGEVSSSNLQAGPFGKTYQYDLDSTSEDLYLKTREIRMVQRRRGGAFAIDTLPADREYRSAAFRHSDVWGW